MKALACGAEDMVKRLKKLIDDGKRKAAEALCGTAEPKGTARKPLHQDIAQVLKDAKREGPALAKAWFDKEGAGAGPCTSSCKQSDESEGHCIASRIVSL
ncbi:hypothetical protein ERJ75_001037300 [Trypanosoma vivax]|nr:hypothetical protein ERJ75_001037300 [Trypanosoma vivax]